MVKYDLLNTIGISMVKHWISCIHYNLLFFLAVFPMKFGDRNPSSKPEMEGNNCNLFQFLRGGDVCGIMA